MTNQCLSDNVFLRDMLAQFLTLLWEKAIYTRKLARQMCLFIEIMCHKHYGFRFSAVFDRIFTSVKAKLNHKFEILLY